MGDEPKSFTDMYKTLSQQNKEQTNTLCTQIQNSEKRVTGQIKQANSKIKKLQEKLRLTERKLRKNNILLFGLDVENRADLIKKTLEKLNQLFSLTLTVSDINNIYFVGKERRAPILVEFLTYLKKSEIFRDPEKLRALKGTGFAVSHDYCKEDREEIKILRKHLKEAKEQNKEAKIKGFRLELEKKLYSAGDLENINSDSASSTTDSESEESFDEEPEILEDKRNKKRKPKYTPTRESGIGTRLKKRRNKK